MSRVFPAHVDLKVLGFEYDRSCSYQLSADRKGPIKGARDSHLWPNQKALPSSLTLSDGVMLTI